MHVNSAEFGKFIFKLSVPKRNEFEFSNILVFLNVFRHFLVLSNDSFPIKDAIFYLSLFLFLEDFKQIDGPVDTSGVKLVRNFEFAAWSQERPSVSVLRIEFELVQGRFAG